MTKGMDETKARRYLASLRKGGLDDSSIRYRVLADKIIDRFKVADLGLGTENYGNLSFTAAKHADSSLPTRAYIDRSIPGVALGGGAIGTEEMGSASVPTRAFIDRSIPRLALGIGAAGSDEIGASAIISAKYADASFPTRAFINRSVPRLALGLKVVGRDELGAAAAGTDEIADVSLTAGKYADSSFPTRAYIDRSIPGIKIALGGVTFDEITNALNNPVRSAFGLRTINSPNGTATAAAGSDHVHSIPFKNLCQKAQDAILEAREAVRAEPDSPTKRLLLGLAHMATDDEHETAEERRERARRGEVEEEMHDYGNGLEPRKKHKWNREIHPDLED